MRSFVALSLLLIAAAPAAAQTFDPARHFLVIATEHFRVYFHEREDRLAARLAAIAERTWHLLERPFARTPPALTHVILVDQTEAANGWATPLPRNTIAIYAVSPAGSDFLKSDDWLTLAFTHEFTHIMHLDRSDGSMGLVRRAFGRTTAAFPNLALPIWQIEGLAVFEESAITREGRVHAGDFRAIVSEAARAGRLEPIDRVSGGLTDWPSGHAAYAYGLGFHAYLANRFGPERLQVLTDATARSVPYLGTRVFASVFGDTLETLWRDYLAFERDAVRKTPAAPQTAERLTHQGFVASGPRFAPPPCAACPAEILYSRQDPHNLPGLYRVKLDGSAPERLVTRVLGSTLGVGARTIYFDQQELRRNAGMYSDLYVRDRATGSTRRITGSDRLIDPDLSPDERTLVAIHSHDGQRDLVVLGVEANAKVRTLIADADTQFNAPRWSPDGRSIAVERQRLGSMPEIVVVDAATGDARTVAGTTGGRWVTPAWRPDGRALVVAGADGDDPFNLYEIDPTTGSATRLTRTTGGATWPDVSPDGKTIVYVGYTADGFDLFRVPYAVPAGESPRTPVQDASAGAATPPVPPLTPVDPSGARPYSPWSTMLPTSWWPAFDTSNRSFHIGAATSGGDLLGYHAYAASALWRVTTPDGAPPVGAAAPDWSISYVYARRRPAWFLSASGDTTFFGGPPTDAGTPSTFADWRRSVEVGLVLHVNHVRMSQTVLASYVYGLHRFTAIDDAFTLRQGAMRAAYAVTTAHRFGYSISPERGLSAGATAEWTRTGLGASGDATAFTGDARAYIPGIGAHHVIAVRMGGGLSRGDRNLQRAFFSGGAGPDDSPIDFGSSAFGLLRGFPGATFAGTHIVVANVEYRWPIAQPQRGLGAWPVMLHSIHAAVFGDAAQVWTRTYAPKAMKTSIGVEISARLVIGYFFPFNATLGAAWGHDGARLVRDGVTAYLRFGYAF